MSLFCRAVYRKAHRPVLPELGVTWCSAFPAGIRGMVELITAMALDGAAVEIVEPREAEVKIPTFISLIYFISNII